MQGKCNDICNTKISSEIWYMSLTTTDLRLYAFNRDVYKVHCCSGIAVWCTVWWYGGLDYRIYIKWKHSMVSCFLSTGWREHHGTGCLGPWCIWRKGRSSLCCIASYLKGELLQSCLLQCYFVKVDIFQKSPCSYEFWVMR